MKMTPGRYLLRKTNNFDALFKFRCSPAMENVTFVIGTFLLRCYSISIVNLCYCSNALSFQRIHKSRRGRLKIKVARQTRRKVISPPHDAHTPASPAAPRARKYLRPSVLRDRYAEVSSSNRP